MAVNSNRLPLPPVSPSGRKRAFSRAPGSRETADRGEHLQLKNVIHLHLPSSLQRPFDHLLEKVFDLHSLLQYRVTTNHYFHFTY